jgi:hypothetical protein
MAVIGRRGEGYLRRDQKVFVLASVTTQQCFNLEINEPLLIIYKMWHTFILFTEDYAEFCNTHFGAMLHHQPFSKNHLKNMIKKLPEHGTTLNEAKGKNLNKQLSFIEDNLGRQTIVKWYVEYSEKYSPEKLSLLQIFLLSYAPQNRVSEPCCLMLCLSSITHWSSSFTLTTLQSGCGVSEQA